MRYKYHSSAILFTCALFSGCSEVDEERVIETQPVEDGNTSESVYTSNLQQLSNEDIAPTSLPIPEFVIDENNTEDDIQLAENDVTEQNNTTAQVNNGELLNKYEGNYLRNCKQDIRNNEKWLTTEVSIQSGVGTSTSSEYSDSSCTLQTAIFNFTVSLVFSGDSFNTPLGVADSVDITIQTALINGEAVAVVNKTIFDIVILNRDSLHFGLFTTERNGNSIGTRPSEIDFNNFYRRL